MTDLVSTLINRLDTGTIANTGIIPWSCPVPSFGDLITARVATLGLNPSNREFVDEDGNELDGPLRRFHTLRSLGLSRWSDAQEQHKELILDSCREYFTRNPYDTWFKRLDHIISGTKASYYRGTVRACHLDLIPYATARKWTALDSHQRSTLLQLSGDTLGLLLSESRIRLLVLNGRSVVDKFQEICGVELKTREMSTWSLPRRSEPDVVGFSYKGVVRRLAGIGLKHDLLVLGFNHNIQSSFGVTTSVMDAIRGWITRTGEGIVA